MAYSILYTPLALEHIRGLSARDRATVMDTIDTQLIHEPMSETRNRKRLRPNPLAPWELRIGEFRVFYDVEVLPTEAVVILAVGIKRGERLTIGSEEIEL